MSPVTATYIATCQRSGGRLVIGESTGPCYFALGCLRQRLPLNTSLVPPSTELTINLVRQITTTANTDQRLFNY